MRRNQLRKVCIQRARSSSRRGCTPPSAVHSFRTMNKWNRPQKNILQVHTANFMIELLWWDEILIRLQHVGWLDYCVPIAHGGCGELGWVGVGERRGLRYVVVPVGISEFPILNDKRDGFFSDWEQFQHLKPEQKSWQERFHWKEDISCTGSLLWSFLSPLHPRLFSLSLLCVRKSSLPRGLSVIMLMGNKEIILNGTLISSALPLPSA